MPPWGSELPVGIDGNRLLELKRLERSSAPPGIPTISINIPRAPDSSKVTDQKSEADWHHEAGGNTLLVILARESQARYVFWYPDFESCTSLIALTPP